MVDLEHLKTLGRRAYEIGRLRRALRISWLLVPLALACLCDARGRVTCMFFALALLAVTVALRWRSRQGYDTAATGLLAGAIPLLAGVIQAGIHTECAEAHELSCFAYILVGGMCAGALIVMREPDWYARRWSCAMAAGIAALAASLGCVRLGSLGVLAAAVGIFLGASAAAAVASSRA